MASTPRRSTAKILPAPAVADTLPDQPSDRTTHWPASLTAYPEMDAERWQRLQDYRSKTRWRGRPNAPTMVALRARILELGGLLALLPMVEDDAEKLLARGQVWAGIAAVTRRGAPSRCHENASALFNRDRERYRIVTGYALSDDGLWRQHSWVLDLTPRNPAKPLVETTLRRLGYFGVMLSPEECEAFYWDNA